MANRCSPFGLGFRNSPPQVSVCGSRICMRRGSCGTRRTSARSAGATGDEMHKTIPSFARIGVASSVPRPHICSIHTRKKTISIRAVTLPNLGSRLNRYWQRLLTTPDVGITGHLLPRFKRVDVSGRKHRSPGMEDANGRGHASSSAGPSLSAWLCAATSGVPWPDGPAGTQSARLATKFQRPIHFLALLSE